MPRTVQDLMLDAVKEGFSMLAHSLYVAIQENIISANDSEISIPYEEFPIEKCLEAKEANILGIYPTYLFAVPFEDYFAMYLAKTTQQVTKLHYQLFHVAVPKIFDMTEKIDTDLFDEQTNKYESFSEIRDRTINFPVLVCCMKKKGK